MKVVTLKPYGYCKGVMRAMEWVASLRARFKDKKIVILGSLVHNENALKSLEEIGIITLEEKSKSLAQMVTKLNKDALVILTAHGHPKEVEEELSKRDIRFIDMTCPFVRHTLEYIKKSLIEGHEIIYIGKKNHPEAEAALSLSNKVHLYDINEGMDYAKVKDDAPVILNQSTFSTFDIEAIIKTIQEAFPKALFVPGTCHASLERQKALMNANKQADLIIIIGSQTSNNAQTLVRLAKNSFKNAQIRFVNNPDEIDKKDLIGLNYAIISSSASTPSAITEAIASKLSDD